MTTRPPLDAFWENPEFSLREFPTLNLNRPESAPINATQEKPDRILSRATGFMNAIFPGQQVGEAIGTLGGFGYEKAKGLFGGEDLSAEYSLEAPTPLQVAGDVARGAVMVGGLKLPVPKPITGGVGIVAKTGNVLKEVGKNVLQYGSLGALGGAGEEAASGGGVKEIVEGAKRGGKIGAIAGSVFNLLGQGVRALAKKVGPSALSFTSGVPKEAIQQTAKSPSVAKEGLGMSVGEVRDRAVGSLKTLQKDLGDEFAKGLEGITSKTGQTKKGILYGEKGFLGGSQEIHDKMLESAKRFAREFRLKTKTTPEEGLRIMFKESPIVKPGEQRVVQEAFNTLSSWKDFSAKGMQDLAERVGALRNFESGAKTESSAIVGRMYHKLAGTGGIIETYFPDLAQLRRAYSANRKVLDEISNIFSADKTKPTQIQASVTRLDNIFKENRDEYLNAVRELAKRSGIDFPSLLAGGEFQKILPNFIRGLGGGAAVSVGASLINPFLWLLAPLFSPRAVGAITRNAGAIGKTVGVGARALTTQVIPKLEQ